jgi:hypothetical protein
MRINQRLLVLRFEWNELLAQENSPGWRASYATAEDQKLTESPNGAQASPLLPLAQRKFNLLRTFCLDIMEVIRDETANWAAEFSDSVEQFEKQLPSGAFLRPGARR